MEIKAELGFEEYILCTANAACQALIDLKVR